MEENFTWAFSSLSLVIKDEPRWFCSNSFGSIFPFACRGLWLRSQRMPLLEHKRFPLHAGATVHFKWGHLSWWLESSKPSPGTGIYWSSVFIRKSGHLWDPWQALLTLSFPPIPLILLRVVGSKRSVGNMGSQHWHWKMIFTTFTAIFQVKPEPLLKKELHHTLYLTNEYKPRFLTKVTPVCVRFQSKSLSIFKNNQLLI